jgi:hypothetical protein
MFTYVAGLAEPHKERHHSLPASEQQDRSPTDFSQNSV